MTLIGLNPSTADAVRDDATTRRVVGFARRAGCGRALIVNLFGWRSSSPSVLRHAPDPIGPDNDSWIRQAVGSAEFVVAAWGTHADPDRVEVVMGMLHHHTIWCLGTTQDGYPRHPLYVPGGTPLQLYAPAEHDWSPWRPVRRTGPGELIGRFCPCGAEQTQPATPPAGVAAPVEAHRRAAAGGRRPDNAASATSRVGGDRR